VDRLKTIYTAARKLNFAFRMTGYPDAPFQNGLADYRPQLHRLTLRFCKRNESSAGMRNFIESSLVKFGVENPTCAIYVNPGRNCTPTLRGEYSNGRIVHLNTNNMSLEQVHLHVNNMRTRSGQPIVKFEAEQTAQCKSIQGEWTPIMWQDTRQNVTPLPHPDFSIHRNRTKTAQEHIQIEASS